MSAKHRDIQGAHIRRNNIQGAVQDYAIHDIRANNHQDDKNIRNKHGDGSCNYNGYKPQDDTTNNKADAKRVEVRLQ